MTANPPDAAGVAKQNANDKPDKLVEVLVDDEPTMVPKDTTPNGILTAAHLDPATHYLVLLQGRHRVEYQGKGEEPIKVHKGETFVSLSTGPTPTS
jgi:hypothetical protein